MSKRVHYSVVFRHKVTLESLLRELNRDQDKIVAVTQSGDFYTIFYEDGGNKEDTE